MNHEKLAPFFFVLAGLAVISISWFTRASLLASKEVCKPLGMAIFLLGIIIFTWTITHLRKAFLGEVVPVTEHLVTSGPYRWVRHPLYLSMIVTLLGISLALRSLWGIIAVPLFFLPVVVYRAGLEEQFLANKFGNGWANYAARTWFLIPRLW